VEHVRVRVEELERVVTVLRDRRHVQDERPAAEVEMAHRVERVVVGLDEHGVARVVELAAGAGVTRNLLYHYFPRGREDIVLAVVERSGRQLTDDWVTDESLPLQERLAANFARIAEHAMEPTDAWRIHRRARAAVEPELAVVVAGFTQVVVESMALNHLGTRRPPELVRLALVGFLSFAETVLDEARTARASRERVMRMLADTLVGTVRAATSAAGAPPAPLARKDLG
jgi:AcrR family transcriptional regulator